ncbi:MAG TPA: circadian clock protein KaiC [Candidatus Saccharimonadales bacterium]|nr:circadian clock protein KaiC [Candidatus Saccharimonadales bacterium]
MRKNRNGNAASNVARLEKARTGIVGFDEISRGGVPKGRPTIVCGGPGCGKTMFGLEFLVRGATQYNEPGVLMTFEETSEEMAKNVASLGFDLKTLGARKKLVLEYVRIEPSEIQETGEYDLEGLFIRLQHAVESIGAKRVVLDTVEAIFSGFSNTGMLRAEIRRLFRWVKDRGLTTIVTAEKGDGTLTRYGLEEYVSDCVIFLDHRVTEQISTRRLRVVKYRGSSHVADEVPFLIDERGFSVMPSTSMRLNHPVSNERVSSGVKDLDDMLEGKGFYRGSSVLVSGTAGSGKSSLAAHFAQQTCRDGKRCLYVALEESPAQATRNMKSIGIDLEKQVKRGLLRFEAWRPTESGLEMHLLQIHKLVEQHKPAMVIIDPITNLLLGSKNELHSMLMRLIDYLKTQQITGFFTALTSGRNKEIEETDVGISSLIDTWLFARDVELNGERNRCIYVLKSRGMAHSNQVREFVMSKSGIRLLPVYVGSGTVLTGSARLSQEARERAESMLRQQTKEEQQRVLVGKRKALEAQIAAMRSEFAQEEARVALVTQQEERRERESSHDMLEMGSYRTGARHGKVAGPNGRITQEDGG